MRMNYLIKYFKSFSISDDFRSKYLELLSEHIDLLSEHQSLGLSCVFLICCLGVSVIFNIVLFLGS